MIPLSEQKNLSDLIKSLETFEVKSEDNKSSKQSEPVIENFRDIPEVSLCNSLTDAISAASNVLRGASLADKPSPSNFAPITPIAPISRISEVFLSDDEDNLPSQVNHLKTWKVVMNEINFEKSVTQGYEVESESDDSLKLDEETNIPELLNLDSEMVCMNNFNRQHANL